MILSFFYIWLVDELVFIYKWKCMFCFKVIEFSFKFEIYKIIFSLLKSYLSKLYLIFVIIFEVS